jgi:predicted nuclease of predicted toxin-antitoxin system
MTLQRAEHAFRLDSPPQHPARHRPSAHRVARRPHRQLGGRSDEDVWAAAQAEDRFLVTHDLDFSDTRKFEPGKYAGVLIVRLPDSEQWRVGDYLVRRLRFCLRLRLGIVFQR